MEGRAGADHRDLSRLVTPDRAADRVLPPAAHRRRGPGPDGAGNGPRHHPLVAAQNGVLTGKYTRDQHGKHAPNRGEWAANFINDKTYDLVEEMARIAKQLDTTVARVALAWVQSRPGVTSTIIGARTMKQLEDNIAALDVKLDPKHVAKLDELSKPQLNFPFDFINNAAPFMQGGTSINSRQADPWPMSPASDAERY